MNIQRTINKEIEFALNNFIKNSSPEPLEEGHWKLYYKFIVLAFKSAEAERPSVSQLSDILREAGFKSPGQLAVLYAHLLYCLALHEGIPIYGKHFNP